MKIKQTFVLAFTFLPFAAHAFFCPTNFQQIDVGNNMDQVKQLCGAPDKETSRDADPKVPQEWTYFIPQTVSAGSATQAQGTLKTTVTFDKDGKALNISVNGIGVGASTICGNNIQLGDDKDAVKSACGKPSFINKQESENASTEGKTKITEWVYNSNPPVTLIFENGKLTGSK